MVANIQIGGKDYTPDELLTLAKAGVLNVGQKHDVSSTTPTATPLVGPFPGNNAQYGPFGATGTVSRPGMWNATARVRSIGDYIPLFKSLNQNEVIDVATGVTAGSGNNVTSACAVGPKPGQLKGARIAATFGIIHASTKIFDVTQAGMRRNYGDDQEKQFFNSIASMNRWLPQVPGIDGNTTFTSLLRSAMLELGIELERNVSQVHFVGVAGTSNNTYRGVATQWDGLDRLIRTGWTDIGGTTTPALDAAVVSFNANADGGTDSASRTIVGALIDTYFAQIDYLRRIGITAEFALVMRPDLFRALAAVWSCSYATTRCTSSSAGLPLTRDAVSIQAEYERIMSSMSLPMEGEYVQVILDDTIARDTLGNGYFKSDIYGVALRGNGRPVLYGEYFDMANSMAEELANYAGGADMDTANDGMYRVFRYQTGGCLEFDFYARPRLITDAPFMHFRVDDLFYRAAYNQHDAQPGASYYYNGGTTYRT